MATTPVLTITVDDERFVRAMHETEDRIGKVLDAIAYDMARELEHEGGEVAPELGEPWRIEGRTAPTSRTVQAPEDAWWAHFIARGTATHGPRTAERMIFTIDGETVSAATVRGITANPFHERAEAATRSHVDEILRRM